MSALAALMATLGVLHAELNASGVRCGRRRVARLMREADYLHGCMRGRRRSTTRRDGNGAPAPDLVDRRFLAASPDRLWLADITYVSTREGFLYLSFILDACSRKVVGWSMADHLRTELWSRTPFGWLCGEEGTRLLGRDPHHSDLEDRSSIRLSPSAASA